MINRDLKGGVAVHSESSERGRSELLFLNLVAMLSTLALQQMGKLTNPITGKPERDLERARDTIDTLEVLRAKTQGNLSESEKGHLDSIILGLQMNYVDESSRKAPDSESRAEESASESKENFSREANDRL